MNIWTTPLFCSILGKRKLNLLFWGFVYLLGVFFVFNIIKYLHILSWEVFHSPPPRGF